MTTWIGWADETAMLEDFEEPASVLDGLEVLIACRYYGSYDGGAFVLLRNRASGELLSVEGSHCSCNGLEHQWSPGTETWATLRARKFYAEDVQGELIQAVLNLCDEHAPIPIVGAA